MRDLLQSTMGGTTHIETRLQRSLWSAMVDPTQLELAVLNLAINARDAMEVGGSLKVGTETPPSARPFARRSRRRANMSPSVCPIPGPE